MGRLVRMDRRRRRAARDSFIARLSLSDTLKRLALLAPADVVALKRIAKARLRHHWPIDNGYNKLKQKGA